MITVQESIAREADEKKVIDMFLSTLKKLETPDSTAAANCIRAAFTRLCPDCRLNRPVHFFHVSRRAKSRRQTYCKTCQLARKRRSRR